MKHFSIAILIIISTFLSKAQTKVQLGNREIYEYNATAVTSKGKIKGILQTTTKDNIILQTKTGQASIPIENIKSLKIKFGKKKVVPIFKNAAQTGLDIITDPELTKSEHSYIKDVNGNIIDLENDETSVGERLLIGGTIMTAAYVGNEITKLIPPANIETFKINYSKDNYNNVLDELSMYSIDMQSSPEYEYILKQKLKEAMNKHKLKVK